MSVFNDIIVSLLEADELEGDDYSFDVKDVTEPEVPTGGVTTVKRHGRFKIVETERYTFLISYLTPVALYDKVFRQYYRTSKHWSPTTEGHISAWQKMIYDTPEWQNNPANQEQSTWGSYVRYPKFKIIKQSQLSKLFRDLMPTMKIKPHMKRRLYHVDPLMRQGAEISKTWLSGHLKHHDSGEEGLPSPDERGFEEFFTDFEPDEPEVWDWSSGLRNTEPREYYKPDEE